MSIQKQTFLILDGNALLHRAWHAIPPLTTKDGLVVNAVYGFAMIMEKIRDTIKPDYMVAAWDLPGKTFRHELFASYKGTRERKEQELYDQIPLIQELLAAYGIRNLSVEGYEADDIIGTLSQKTQNQDDVETIVMSGDLDLLQLVNDRTTVLFFQKGISETKRYNKEAVLERFGLSPEELIDYKALRGDTSDNIPGVKGIGEKTAEVLIKPQGSLGAMFKACDAEKIPKKMTKKLRGQKKTVFLARKQSG